MRPVRLEVAAGADAAILWAHSNCTGTLQPCVRGGGGWLRAGAPAQAAPCTAVRARALQLICRGKAGAAAHRLCLVRRRFVDLHGLEAACERGVALDALRELLGGGRRHAAQRPARERRLEQRRQVQPGAAGARGRTGAGRGVQLVDKEDGVAAGPSALERLDELTRAVLDLAALLRAGQQQRDVKLQHPRPLHACMHPVLHHHRAVLATSDLMDSDRRRQGRPRSMAWVPEASPPLAPEHQAPASLSDPQLGMGRLRTSHAAVAPHPCHAGAPARRGHSVKATSPGRTHPEIDTDACSMHRQTAGGDDVCAAAGGSGSGRHLQPLWEGCAGDGAVGRDEAREPLSHCCLADAGLAQQQRVVLPATS